MATKGKLDTLLQWFSDNEIFWENNEVEIREKDGSFGVYALKDIPKKDEASMSMLLLRLGTFKQTCSCQRFQRSQFYQQELPGFPMFWKMSGFEGGCSLAIAVM